MTNEELNKFQTNSNSQDLEKAFRDMGRYVTYGEKYDRTIDENLQTAYFKRDLSDERNYWITKAYDRLARIGAQQ